MKADEPWPWDVVFAEVSGELLKEWYPEEEETSSGENDKPADKISKPPSAENSVHRGPTKERPYTAFNRFPV